VAVDETSAHSKIGALFGALFLFLDSRRKKVGLRKSHKPCAIRFDHERLYAT
jgi:hypothetical protein